MAPSLSDLRYAFFGGGSAAEYAFLLNAQTAGMSAADLLYLGYHGTGSPEGVVTAPVGSLYVDRNNGTIYSKTAGVGNTGWVAAGSGGGGGTIVPFTIGDAVASVFPLNHNLNTRRISVDVRDVNTNEFVYPKIVANTVNQVTVTFTPTIPAANSYEVTVR